jgi:hypothetical protein
MSDDNKASSSQVALREEFVENARRFFKNPKIRSTPLDEQKKFLISKGVTQAEIDAALDTIPTTEVTFKSYSNNFSLSVGRQSSCFARLSSNCTAASTTYK